MRVTLIEIFGFNFMQSDPNFSNFMVDKSTQKLVLLDFGSAIEYKKTFCDQYYRLIDAASKKDFPKVIQFS